MPFRRKMRRLSRSSVEKARDTVQENGRGGHRRVALPRRIWHMSRMSNAVPHPYSIDVSPMAKPEGHYQWAIRKSGKLMERSDRPYRSEAKAHESAMEAIERAMKPGFDGRR